MERLKNEENEQINFVSSSQQLLDTAFQGKSNVVCWKRDLQGDFSEIISALDLEDNTIKSTDITEVSMPRLESLSLSAQGSLARDIILQDFKLLQSHGTSPSLNLLKCYQKDTEFDFISTDVYSFHVDRAPEPTDTFLCTYVGAVSDVLPNEMAIQKVLIPEVREKLFSLYGGDISGFEEFLEENYFDLHYQPKSGAKPTNLGLGNLCKLAVDYPEQTVLPCVHRAPLEKEKGYRLLLIC